MKRIARTKRISLLTVIMAEPICLPGFPQIIVTRGFAYQWYKSLGWSASERGFGSLDYQIYAAPVTTAALTPASEREYWLARVAEDFRRS